jgi:uncharacterized protein (TIGR00251 family)
LKNKPNNYHPDNSGLPGFPPYLKPTPEGIVLSLWIKPGARKTVWAGVRSQELMLMVQALPVEGAANQSCLSFLARWFGMKRSEVVLLKGGKSRSKAFLLKGLTLERCLSLIPGQNPDQSNS